MSCPDAISPPPTTHEKQISVWKRMAKELLLAAMRADPHEFAQIIHSGYRWVDLIRRDLLRHVSATDAGRLAPRTSGVNEMGQTVLLARHSQGTRQESAMYGIHVAIVAGQPVPIAIVLFAAVGLAAPAAEMEFKGSAPFGLAGALVEGPDRVAAAIGPRAVQTQVVAERVGGGAVHLPRAAGAVDTDPEGFAVESVAEAVAVAFLVFRHMVTGYVASRARALTGSDDQMEGSGWIRYLDR